MCIRDSSYPSLLCLSNVPETKRPVRWTGPPAAASSDTPTVYILSLIHILKGAMNMEIRLPIELKTAVITECWTFEKLAVIQSSPLADDWLASHLSLYMDAEFSCYFGDGESYYCLLYTSRCV